MKCHLREPRVQHPPSLHPARAVLARVSHFWANFPVPPPPGNQILRVKLAFLSLTSIQDNSSIWKTSWAPTDKRVDCGRHVCIRQWLLQTPDYRETISMELSLALTGSDSKLAPKSYPPPPPHTHLRSGFLKRKWGCITCSLVPLDNWRKP